MPNHSYQCASCGGAFDAIVAWDAYTVPCPSCGASADRVYTASHVIDDTLPGGARYMHNLGDHPVWVETKTELRKELAKRGLVPAERNAYAREDKSPWATKHHLRPGQHDPFLHRS